MTEILWFRLLNPKVVSYCRGHLSLLLVNRLEGLSLPRNSATINWPARHDLVDWAVKLQHKQTKAISGKLSDYLVSCEAVPRMRRIIWTQAWDFLVEASTPSLIIFLTHHHFLYFHSKKWGSRFFFLSAQEYKNAICKIAASQTDWEKLEPKQMYFCIPYNKTGKVISSFLF